ncbi:NADH-quinone oxidoreductase subunit J [Epidermidibacterium keratini]|uniref:NADH-quinone oxidoreductase subunit J n=1 Tax=Epidermidibacterium keratini TaxID=1891644 RepID=A0A7L4YL09_9ACTN|nr:NADH-quinone oxidoreductase subunit J [Epidermidibacterium keratini]QHB99747.1 NADH-quinone oxidoreductase subunit J [Epidermidibacterium keratini]
MSSVAVLAAEAGQMSEGEVWIFALLAPVAVLGALGMLFSRNAIHSALWLVGTMLSLGVFYMAQAGPFLGVVQIIVYTGAIMILFVFVLMLVGRDSNDSLIETLRGQRAYAAWFGIGFAVIVAVTVYRATEGQQFASVDTINQMAAGNVRGLAALIFTDYLFAFEVAGALLVIATIGAMVLAHIERDRRHTQKERALQRFASKSPYPLVGPGVFANSHSVATPALLPDGRVAPESQARGVEMQAPPGGQLITSDSDGAVPPRRLLPTEDNQGDRA